LDIKTELKTYIAEELLLDYAAQDLGDGDSLLTDGMVDSLGMVRLLAFITERFEIEIPPEDLTIENFQNIGLIVSYLEKRQN
jgi:acyl carrier protein